MKLDLQSEKYAATGNISAGGIRRTLGTPTLDRLQILIRESVQNSWDARRDEGEPVSFTVRIRVLAVEEQQALSEIFSDLPSASRTRNAIADSLRKPRLAVLEISDSGTSGLGGPVRADEEPKAGDHPDFVNFFRNVGSARDRELGGGTYGYGKSALFRFSQCGTLVGYTRATAAGRDTTRLIGCSLGEEFEHRRVRYTGRHWWGRKSDDGIVDPVTGATADSLAASLGLKRRTREDFGTSLLVIDADFDERTSPQAGNAVVECLVWFFWPKLMERPNGRPAMRFVVEVDGKLISVPEIAQFPPLALFKAAMSNAKTAEAVEVRCERPARLLGRLGIVKGPKLPRMRLDTGSDRQLIPDQSACIALMRPAELVVKYLATPPIASDMVEYAGVFICDTTVESSFADAEPPAHDDWIADFLERPGKVFVNVALRRIQDSAARFANPVSAETTSKDQRSLGAIADSLGDVLLGQQGTRVDGPEVSARDGRAGPSSTSRREIIVSEPLPFGFAVVRRVSCALFRVKVTSFLPSITLRAQALIVLEGGATEPAADSNGPRVIGWLGPKGEHVSATTELILEEKTDDWFHVAVSVDHDAAIAVEVSASGRD
jgi:hypothetical protein